MAHYIVEQDWITPAGYRAVVIMTERGHRCGYVGVSQDHPLYRTDYSATTPAIIPPNGDDEIGLRNPITLLLMAGDPDNWETPESAIDVHGSLTYSDGGEGSDYPVISDLWWFGFDCAHYGDIPTPEAQAAETARYGHPMNTHGVHRTLEYCIQQCESLAEQLTNRVLFN